MLSSGPRENADRLSDSAKRPVGIREFTSPFGEKERGGFLAVDFALDSASDDEEFDSLREEAFFEDV